MTKCVSSRTPRIYETKIPNEVLKTLQERARHSKTKNTIWPEKKSLIKIATIAGMIFGAFFYFQKPSAMPIAESFSRRDIINTRQEFPSYLASMFFPGLIANLKGTFFCHIKEIIPSVLFCDLLGEYIIERQKELNQETQNQIVPIPFPLENSFVTKIQFLDDSQIVINGIDALAFLENQVLKNKDSLSLKPDELSKIFLETHRLVMKDIPRANPGRYRVSQGASCPAKRGGDVSNQSLWGFTTFAKSIQIDNMSSFYGINEHFGVKPESIKKQMEEFFFVLKSKLDQLAISKKNLFAVAAWVHQKLLYIRPFSDGNRRVARAWMNVVLQLGGNKAVIFPNAKEYEEAIKVDRKFPGRFQQFLEKTFKQNRKAKALSEELVQKKFDGLNRFLRVIKRDDNFFHVYMSDLEKKYK